jgi:2'-5' RNA ligase
MSGRVRAFVAIDVPADSLPELLRVCEALGAISGVRSVDPSLLHITVQFLGEIDQAQAQLIASSLGPAASSCRSFEIAVEGLGAFPSVSRPQVVWAGCESSGLAALASRAREALAAAGFRPDKRFEPHITLGRVKRPPDHSALRKLLESWRDSGLGTFRVDEVKLKKSDLAPGGPIYADLYVLKLAAVSGA